MVRTLGFLIMTASLLALGAPDGGHEADGGGPPDAGSVLLVGSAVLVGGTQPLKNATVTVYKKGSEFCSDGTGPRLKRGLTGADGAFRLEFTAAEAKPLPPKGAVCVRVLNRGAAAWSAVGADVESRPLDVGSIAVSAPDPIASKIQQGCVGNSCSTVALVSMVIDPHAVEARLVYFEELKELGTPEALTAYAEERSDLLKSASAGGDMKLRNIYAPSVTASLKTLCKSGCSSEELESLKGFRNLKVGKNDVIRFVPHR